MEPKPSHQKEPPFDLKNSDFRAYHEDVVLRTLNSVKRHWIVAGSCVLLALAVGISTIPLIPTRYTAVALVYPSLVSSEPGKFTIGSVDASSVVLGEARLVSSDVVLRAVVKRLGLDVVGSNSGPPSWARKMLEPLASLLAAGNARSLGLRPSGGETPEAGRDCQGSALLFRIDYIFGSLT